MKTIERTYTLQITEQEAELLTEFLHSQYKEYKKEYTAGGGTAEKKITTRKKLQACKEFRDHIANLIGKFYMGEDA